MFFPSIHITKKPSALRRTKRAFTLTELLVVIVVITLLIAILPAALQGSRAQSKKIVCLSNLYQIGTIWTTYADESTDYYPPRFNTGGFNYVMEFVHDYLNDLDVGDGKVFYCADYIYRKDSVTGEPRDWYHPYSPGYVYEKVYEIGYDTFTHVIAYRDTTRSIFHPNNLPWYLYDGTPPLNMLSWDYAYQYCDSELYGIIPPVKTTERSHIVGSAPQRIIIIPEKSPIVFDEAWSPTTDKMVFAETRCRHYNPNTRAPSFIQAVYMDGHATSRSAEDIRVLRYKGPYGQHWL